MISANLMKKLGGFCLIVGALAILPICAAKASGGEDVKLPKIEWPFKGPLGSFDKAAMQRGFQVYREVCSACHGLDHLYYRNLKTLGYSDAQINSVAAEYTVIDGPNDEGEMFDRPAKGADKFVNPFPNEKAARYANGGAYPPDLSLIGKARKDGANYVYALLTGYTEPPHDIEVVEGKHYNKYFPGHWISMAAPITDGMITYSNGESATVEQAAYDVVNFLSFAAAPEMIERKRLGVQVILFLIVFAGLMYAVKKKIWKDVH